MEKIPMDTALQKEVKHGLLVGTVNSVSRLMDKGLSFDKAYSQACAEEQLSEEEERDFRKKVGILLKARRVKKQHAGSKNIPNTSTGSSKKEKTTDEKHEEQISLFESNTYLD